ncbi:MAG: hypothetical protein FWF52_10885 [Candidatus Azobacteroides sp.]|nr:hypothetical protein [Candidatus Azobacteroides sp.]
MKRRNFLKLLTIGGALVALEVKSAEKVLANEMVHSEPDLIHEVEKYINQNIRLSGKIRHVCSANGKKMKLQTSQGLIIKVVSQDSNAAFDKSYNGKNIAIEGFLLERKITGEKITNMEKANLLLCPIDHTPCIDSAWVKKQRETGRAAEIMKNDIQKLREQLKNSGKGYLSQFTVTARTLEEIS